MKYCRHTPLKSSRCITQTKRHTPISIITVRTRESGLLLIRGVNMNLREARIPIKITKVGVFRQPLKHLINKGQRIVVLPGGLVQLPEINTHSISNNSPLRYLFIFIIRNHSHTSFLRNTMNWTYPLNISYRIDDTCG